MGIFAGLYERTKAKVIFLKQIVKDVYKFVGVAYIDEKAERLRYRSRTYVRSKTAEYLNKFGKPVSFMDIDTGASMHMQHNKGTPPIGPRELDKVVTGGLIEGFVRVFQGAVKRDWMMIIMSIGCGVGIGIVIGMFIG